MKNSKKTLHKFMKQRLKKNLLKQRKEDIQSKVNETNGCEHAVSFICLQY